MSETQAASAAPRDPQSATVPCTFTLRPTPEQALLLAHFAYSYGRICGTVPLGSRLSPLAESKLLGLDLVWLRGVPPQVIKAAIAEKRDGGERPEGPFFRFVSRSQICISKRREKRRGPVIKRCLILPELGWVVMDGKLPRRRILVVTIWRGPDLVWRAVADGWLRSLPPSQALAASAARCRCTSRPSQPATI